MSSLRHNLQSRGKLLRQLNRRLGDLLQHAVHAQPHAVHLFERFEVDIRRAPTNGVQHDLIDEADDRRIFHIIAGDLVVELIFSTRDLQRLEIDISLLAERRHLVVDLLERLIDCALQLIVFDNDGLDAKAALKFDLVNCVQVGRVRHREEQALAAPKQRQHAMLRDELLGDQADGVQLKVDSVQVKERHAKLVRGRYRDVAGIGRPTRHELRDDTGLTLAGGAQRIQHGGLFDDAILDQPLRQAT